MENSIFFFIFFLKPSLSVFFFGILSRYLANKTNENIVMSLHHYLMTTNKPRSFLLSIYFCNQPLIVPFSFFTGKIAIWLNNYLEKFVRNEDFEEFLTENGVPLLQRKIMLKTSPNLEIKRDLHTWSFTLTVLVKTQKVCFRLREKLNEENHVFGDKNEVREDWL